MYTTFFGFKEKPFSLVPNPAFLFLSQAHENAMTYLEYGLSENVGFVLLTGEIGSGKTTLVRHILNQMDDKTEVAVLFNTGLVSDDLVFLILSRFDIPFDPGISRGIALEKLYAFLIDRYSMGRRTLLVIDEAQNLSKQSLEDIRMLSNLQTDNEMLLQVMIVGQPELKKTLYHPRLEQLSQRIAASYHLGPMDEAETREYIAHRLVHAGGDPEVIRPDAIEKIFQISGGIPRTINLICDAAFVYAYADGRDHIAAETIGQVAKEDGGIGIITKEMIQEPESDADQLNEERLSRIEQAIERLEKKIDSCAELLIRLDSADSSETQ